MIIVSATSHVLHPLTLCGLEIDGIGIEDDSEPMTKNS